MATYASLTTEQKNVLGNFDTLLRAAAGDVAKMCNLLDALNADYNVQTSAILASLDSDGVIIPSNSGLDGKGTLTRGEMITLVSYVQGILAFNSTAHRQNYAKAAGAANLIR